VKANKLITEEFIRRLDHNKRLDVLFLIIERRIGLDGTLMIALRMCASVGIGSLDSLSVLNFVVNESVL
jgi:hypothetical protein